MYGKPVKELTIDEILSRVSEWDLWSYYVPGVQLKKKFKSPLRKDEEPSASLFVNRQNSILFKDFGTGETMNIWSFLQARYSVTFREALLLVNNDFNLKLASKGFKVKPSMELFGVITNRVIEQKEPSVIKIKKRAWSTKDKEYWGQYGLTSEFLDSRDVKPVQNYWVNDHLVYWHSDNNPAYSYEFGKGKRKVYSPYAKKFKFLTNAGDKVMQGLAYLPKTAECLIITKSYKDVLVLQSLGYHSIAPQSESMSISTELMDNLKKRFKYIYLLYDNDATGKKYSKKLCVQYRLMPIFVPEPIKDISDYRKTYGIVQTLGLLKSLVDEDREREEIPESY